MPNSSQDPFGKSGARQEDRDQAALFTARYAAALEQLRAKSFKGSDKVRVRVRVRARARVGAKFRG